MFVNSLLNYDNKDVSVVGIIEKLDDDIVFLKSGEHEIMVKHNGLDSYKSKYVRVKGKIINGVLIEHVVNKIPDEFDMKLFNRFVELNMNFGSIF